MKNNSLPELETYVALLRGINVGGHKKASMAEMKKVFAKMGFKNVGSILATGNIIFDGPKRNAQELSEIITATLEHSFEFPIPVVIRSLSEIKELIAQDPFAGVNLSQQTRFYVSFLPGKPKNKLPLPYNSSDGSFQIIKMIGNSVISVLDLDKTQTPEVMNILEKEYGKEITTRNWNTVLKIGKA